MKPEKKIFIKYQLFAFCFFYQISRNPTFLQFIPDFIH